MKLFCFYKNLLWYSQRLQYLTCAVDDAMGFVQQLTKVN